jgi:hypothetical protein
MWGLRCRSLPSTFQFWGPRSRIRANSGLFIQRIRVLEIRADRLVPGRSFGVAAGLALPSFPAKGYFFQFVDEFYQLWLSVGGQPIQGESTVSFIVSLIISIFLSLNSLLHSLLTRPWDYLSIFSTVVRLSLH